MLLKTGPRENGNQPAGGCHHREIVGRGHTSHLGGPHAEIHALWMAGEKAKGATVYCTLEPCAHYGRAPLQRSLGESASHPSGDST
jgi:pyrimidine deaminase RibD-like protein